MATADIVQVGIIYIAIGCDVEDNAFEDLASLIQICKVTGTAELAKLDGASGDLVLDGLEVTECNFYFDLERHPVGHTLIHRAGESDLPYAIECWIKLGKAGPSMVETPS